MESAIQKQVKKAFQRQGYKVIKIIQLSENGYPDLMCMKNGEVIFIEVKGVEGKPRPLQMYRMKELANNGFKVMWTKDGLNYESVN